VTTDKHSAKKKPWGTMGGIQNSPRAIPHERTILV